MAFMQRNLTMYRQESILQIVSGRAKIFYNGGSQAVRLPKSCRFPEGQREVVVRRVGKKVILEPADEWSTEFLEALGSWSEEIE
jgi:antitoxin VapB